MGRRLTVTHVSVEEDSCREVKDKGHQIIWRTDRLGMPLTETVTGAELRTPQEVRDAILLCGLVARSTRRVRVGIGASREDVNVSVRGGNRVEIKGVPKAGFAVKLVHNEGVRQCNLLKLREELHRRGLKSLDQIHAQSHDVTDVFAEVDLGFLRRAVEAGGRIFAVKVEGVRGLAQHATQPDTNFLDELSGRIRVIACLDDRPIVLSGALMPEFPNRHLILERLRKRTQLGEQDDYFIVFGPEEDCRTAANEIRLRFGDATQGVPKETRQPLLGGFTTFERILPGPDRMYPDTDSPPTGITSERVEEARTRLRPPPWDRIARYRSLRVPEETASYLIRRGGADIVDAVVQKTGVDGLVAAMEIGQRAKALRRAGVPIDRLRTEEWVQVFDRFTDGRLPRDLIPAVASKMAQDRLDADAACKALGVSLEAREKWQPQARDVTLDGYGAKGPKDSKSRQARYLTGKAVKMLKGKAPAKEVAALIFSKLGAEETP
jgi:glutamyl-tRNA(Gln) amidotransferase subunit E